MAVYAYIATGDGASVSAPMKGTITADSPRQARDQLRARGLVVREVIEQKATAGQSPWSRYLWRRLASQTTTLLQEMSTLLAAGIPLLEALDTIARQHEGRMKQAILLLRDHVAAGGGLADAMSKQPLLFDSLCISIVEVGENAGTLDSSLARLVEFRRRNARLKNRVTSAMIYPAIVLCVGVAVSVFLMTFVVPNLLEVLTQSGKTLPFATRVIQGLSNLITGWWWAILLVVVGSTSLVSSVLKTERGKRAWDRMQLRIPLIGELIRKQSIARLSMMMATLLKSDVVFAKSLRIVRNTVTNTVLRDALEACETAVTAGRDISVALEKTHAFPPLVIQVFAVGQASGRLEEMLENLATDYDAHVDITAGRLTAMLEPLMMIFLAISVGFIAFATILPILEAGDVL
ncbi:MAG: hypothetical protein GC164_02400 [Phycisphaera sp.]|nr:hypothetical protein [Phycisphaera sp.]